jgi:hypothetical protein
VTARRTSASSSSERDDVPVLWCLGGGTSESWNGDEFVVPILPDEGSVAFDVDWRRRGIENARARIAASRLRRGGRAGAPALRATGSCALARTGPTEVRCPVHTRQPRRETFEESPDITGQDGRATDPGKPAGKCHRNTPPMAPAAHVPVGRTGKGERVR